MFHFSSRLVLTALVNICPTLLDSRENSPEVLSKVTRQSGTPLDAGGDQAVEQGYGGGLRGFLPRYLEKLKWDLFCGPTIRLNEVGFTLNLRLIFQLHGATETLGGLW